MSGKTDIFALFIDIDGTLTGDNHIIPQRTIDAINKARALGHKVFINTGRSYGNIPPEVLSQVELDGVLSGNGTMITIDGVTSFERYMDRDVMNKIAKHVFDSHHIWAAFEGVKGSYITINRNRKLNPYQKPVSDYEEYLKLTADDNIQVIAVSTDIETEYLDSLKDDITYFTFSYYYDIVSKGNNKSLSMARVLDMLGIPGENSIAFGDSENDLDMLKNAGIGVAMSNAQPCLLDSADFVSISNRDGGVGYAIEKILLKGD